MAFIKLILLVILFIFYGFRKLFKVFLRPFSILDFVFPPLLRFLCVNFFRSLVYSGFSFYSFFLVLFYSFLFFILFLAASVLSLALSPLFLVQFLIGCLTLIFYGLILGPLRYVSLFFSVLKLSISSFFFKLSRCLVVFIQFLLNIVEAFHSIVYFLSLLRTKPSYSSRVTVRRYGKRYLLRLFLTGFLSQQVGTVSFVKLEDSARNTNIYAIENYFVAGVPESLPVESAQQQEAFLGETSTDFQSGSFDAFYFLQFLKRARTPRLYTRPCFSKRIAKLYSDSTQSVFSVEGFLQADINYRLYCLHRELHFSVPRRYEPYIFVRYLVPAFSLMNRHYHFLASNIFHKVNYFKIHGLPYQHKVFDIWFASFNDELTDSLSLYSGEFDSKYAPEADDYFVLDYFDEPDITLARTDFDNSYSAGLHFTQLVDDSSLFTRPFNYVKPRFERYWFKRALDFRLFNISFSSKSFLVPRFFSQFPLVFVSVFEFLKEIPSFILGALLALLDYFFKLVDLFVPSFRTGRAVAREFFFRFLNVFLFSGFDGSLVPLFVESLPNRLHVIKEAAIIRSVLFVNFLAETPRTLLILFYGVFGPFLTCFNFCKFCWCQLRNGTFLQLVENEFDSRLAAYRFRKEGKTSVWLKILDKIFR